MTKGPISQIEDEREGARQDLRDTLTEVNAKVERAGNDLRPDHLMEAHPFAACLVAGVFGLLMGASAKNRATMPIVIAALAGFALSRSSSNSRGADDGREISSGD